MAAIVAAIVVVALVAGLNVLFSLALARRLRLLGEQGTGRSASDETKALVPSIGHVVSPFETKTVGGTSLTDADFNSSSSLVLFASVGCSPCERLKTELLENPPSEIVRVFVHGSDSDQPPPFAAALEAISNEVVWMGSDETARRVFGDVGLFPTILRIVNGVVVASGTRLEDIPPTGKRSLARA